MSNNFFWYERHPEIYEAEIATMRKYYPQFRLVKSKNGTLSWEGYLTINDKKAKISFSWYLQLVYLNSHPDNSSFGGSIRVYVISPDIKKIANDFYRKTGISLPHILKDSHGDYYLCTGFPKDFNANVNNRVTTAAAAMGFVIKWIYCYHLWKVGTISTDDFASHKY